MRIRGPWRAAAGRSRTSRDAGSAMTHPRNRGSMPRSCAAPGVRSRHSALKRRRARACAACGHLHPDNRHTQAAFVYQRCRHQDNTDANASRVIAQRGVGRILSGQDRARDRKRTIRLRSKVQPGPERFKATPTETTVSLDSSNAFQLGSVPRVTPATTPGVERRESSSDRH